VIYLDEDIEKHPKFIRAGAIIGGGADGRARAFALWVGALGYARRYLTDGEVPADYLESAGFVSKPLTVAEALVRAKLFDKCPRGFRIHDYHDRNKSAAKIRRERRKWRDEKREQRHGSNGRFSR
jgi:hypothetical protein